MEQITVREANELDSRDLWEWRNNPVVRKEFFDPMPVSWEGHQKWFNVAIANPKTRIYMAQIGDAKIGVIRFEIESEIAKVSVNLNPDYFGKHLGSKIIKLGTEKLFNEMNRAKSVLAEIKSSNLGSQKAFANAGYELREQSKDLVLYKIVRRNEK
jgi:RimJ/RimL family protein N-acetyltransferase